MSYRTVRYFHQEDAHAACMVLEDFGIEHGGPLPTRVGGVRDGEEATEWEVWALPGGREPPTVIATTARDVEAARGPEPDEHDRGRSTRWDEEHEQRDY